ncbi:MAG: Uma2 family endonuclease [Isosphaeraceae bacterium]
MSSASTIIPIASAAPSPAHSLPSGATRLSRFNVDEYERMVLDNPRVELSDGYVVTKVPKNPAHSWSTKAVNKGLDRLLPPGWTSRQEQPAWLSDFDEPDPHVTIVRGVDDDDRHRHPLPADVGLLVEVSESTLDRDRNETLPAFARGGIAVYWIVNLVDRQVEVYSSPDPGLYRSAPVFRSGQQVPVILDGRLIGQIGVDDVLP